MHHRHRATQLLLLAALAVAAAACGDRDATAPSWTLAWSDEFDAAAGAPPDPANWKHDVGTDWGNAQLEYDTDRPENASHDGEGNLVITARRESFGGRNFTSARLTTAGRHAFQYGRFEARMKLPRGQGMWPAFWLLGANFPTVGWPATGEIDIMEYRGQEPAVVHGSLHGPGYSGGSALTRRYAPAATRFDNSFHVFAVEWSEDELAWFVDGTRFFRVSRESVPGTWVFDHPFNIILNLAVGGNYVGAPNDVTPFPNTLVVDWVRVYSASP